MNIQLLDTKSGKPIANTKIQIQLKGKENGLLWVNTNYKGIFELESKYTQHHLSVPSLNSPAVEAKDGAVLRCEVGDQKGGGKSQQPHPSQGGFGKQNQKTAPSASLNKNDPFNNKGKDGDKSKQKDKIKDKETTTY